MKNKPFISQKLDVRIRPGLDDEGLRETAEFYLAVPAGECEFTDRDFGVIVKKPNYFQRVIPTFYPISERYIDGSKQYVISEMLLCLDPKASTVMMSHEGELFELVQVIGPERLEFNKAVRLGGMVVHSSHGPDKIFYAVEPNPNYDPSEKNKAREFFGFYHQLVNPSDVLNLSHIMLLAEKKIVMKDGMLMRYGINRPSNTWKE